MKMQTVQMSGRSVEVPTAWVQWVRFVGSYECGPRYLASQHESWGRGAITREESPVFLDYWQAQERKSARGE